MHALFIAGVFFAAAFTFVLGGSFFVQAWRFRRA